MGTLMLLGMLNETVSIPIPRYTPKRKENVSPHKDLHVNVHSNIMPQMWKQSKSLSTDEWLRYITDKMQYMHIIQ